VPRTEQEQVEQIGHYITLLLEVSNRLRRRQRFLTRLLVASAFVVPLVAGVALLLGGGDASIEWLVVLFASAVVSVVALLVRRTQTSVRTTEDRLLSLVHTRLPEQDSVLIKELAKMRTLEEWDAPATHAEMLLQLAAGIDSEPTTTTSRTAKSLS
jgi:hypothetical protein